MSCHRLENLGSITLFNGNRAQMSSEDSGALTRVQRGL
jgi:hypothetical protein